MESFDPPGDYYQE
jgi:hypothetical protein